VASHEKPNKPFVLKKKWLAYALSKKGREAMACERRKTGVKLVSEVFK